MEIETMDTTGTAAPEPKRPGRKPGSPKVPGSGRIKGKPAGVPENIRAVCREVLGLDNLAIRKRMKRWFESGDGLSSTTFRHILIMGYGQPKHAMEIDSGLARRRLAFITAQGLPWENDPLYDREKKMLEAQKRDEALQAEVDRKRQEEASGKPPSPEGAVVDAETLELVRSRDFDLGDR
jgi:hypothetical protein